MPVAETSAASAQQFYLLAVIVHLAEKFAGVGVIDHGAAGHLHHHVGAVFSRAAVGAAALTVAGKDMAVEFQGQESPHVGIAAQYDVASAAAVAAVGSAFRHIFGSVEMA